jgi:hypothetical protein
VNYFDEGNTTPVDEYDTHIDYVPDEDEEEDEGDE